MVRSLSAEMPQRANLTVYRQDTILMLMFPWLTGSIMMAKNKDKKGKSKRVFRKLLSKTGLTDWCDETLNYQYKTDMVSYNSKRYLYRHGTGNVGFISIHKNDFTIVHIYRSRDAKREYISTRRFAGELSWRRVKEIIFSKSIHISIAQKIRHMPFKTIYKQTIIPIEEFKEKFKPNEQMKKSYSSTAKDTALTSLSDILKDVDSVGDIAGTHSAAFNNVRKAISFGDNSYSGSRPAVSIYAIWSNYDPESRLINDGEFDIGEPVLYEYRIIRKK